MGVEPATSCSTDKELSVHSVSQRPLCPQVTQTKEKTAHCVHRDCTQIAHKKRKGDSNFLYYFSTYLESV